MPSYVSGYARADALCIDPPFDMRPAKCMDQWMHKHHRGVRVVVVEFELLDTGERITQWLEHDRWGEFETGVEYVVCVSQREEVAA